MAVIGWDIGGVNTKVARVRAGKVLAVQGRPFELQRAPDALVPLLRALASEVGGEKSDSHSLTMTAELSQMFRSKREGVHFVLDAIRSAFPESTVYVYTVDGHFVAPDAARPEPLSVAAANWAATANLVARHHPDALLIDIGTTTTDIIPIVAGRVAAEGLTDAARLQSGELVYTGALRTPVEAISAHVPLGSALAGVSAEGFAAAGDVHVWRGDLSPDDYTVPTPDGRPAAREFAGERLARVVCADREMLDEAAVTRIADALATAQIQTITSAIERVLERHPNLDTAVVTGLGAFIGSAAARAAGLQVIALSDEVRDIAGCADEVGDVAARCAPATAVALLCEAWLERRPEGLRLPINPPVAGGLQPSGPSSPSGPTVAAIDVVVKLGGGLLAHPEHFSATLKLVAAAASEQRLLVVPGGGLFADAVRDVNQRLDLDDDVAHWMAILGMDQYAHLIASRLERALLVTGRNEIAAALASGRIPVLAPYRWLHRVDPLPHSWDVTSDSIAAWIAGELSAARLVLIKPPGASGSDLVDAHFDAGTSAIVLAADQSAALAAAMRVVSGFSRTAAQL